MSQNTKNKGNEGNGSVKGVKLNYAKVYILYTGGTIGMLHDPKKGLVPVKGNLTKLIDKIKIREKLNIDYKIERTDPLIDSSNLRDSDWKAMLTKLYQNYDKYDSFIVIHGTDTLAYTASALSFFLRSWNKTVIVTGSQIPLFEFRNDARNNILSSVIMSLYRISDVIIVFGGKIIRGNRATKYSSIDFIAYHSPNYRRLGQLDVSIILDDNIPSGEISDKTPIRIPNIPSDWTLDQWNSNIDILPLTLLPRENSIALKSLIDLKPNAIILRTYGIGNAPVGDSKFIEQLNRANRKGIIVINTTQCLNGGVNMDYYNTGKALKKTGVVGCGDATFESVYTKLFYLFQLFGTDGNNTKIIKKLLAINIAGELTETGEDSGLRRRLKGYFKGYQEL